MHRCKVLGKVCLVAMTKLHPFGQPHKITAWALNGNLFLYNIITAKTFGSRCSPISPAVFIAGCGHSDCHMQTHKGTSHHHSHYTCMCAACCMQVRRTEYTSARDNQSPMRQAGDQKLSGSGAEIQDTAAMNASGLEACLVGITVTKILFPPV